MGWKENTAVSPFNDTFKDHRRLLAQTVGGKNAEQFWPVEERDQRKFLLHLIEEPQNLVELIRRLEGSIMLDIVYGYSVKGNNDPLVVRAEETMDHFSQATTPGAYMVEIIPAMRFIPEWLPGGRFKKIAREWGLHLRGTVEMPFEFAKKEMTAGKSRPSFTTQMLTEGEESEELVKSAAFSLYTGGSDTVSFHTSLYTDYKSQNRFWQAVAALSIFFLLMILNPDVQTKAQAEIDTVTQGQYLPTWSDRAKLPYIEAVMLECLRWGPIAPLAFPHRCMSQDEFEGYRIPEGTLCIPNVWATLHDPEYYTDPMKFSPERFLKDSPELDPRNIVFGFGRR
ncbi:hypothetical protein VKT23_011886 [Stygiomarasmius scandens]|uniref:Cytochrome P450 n=1 Tax=Marasmiellus scandens TaxID=2682957 RepID=A0ABR1J9W9_9AGAR